MSKTFRACVVRAALLAAGSGLAGASALASQNIAIAVGTCPASSVASMQADLKLTNGAVRKPGRNPPSRYFCGVPIDDLAASPSWNTLELQYRDENLAGNGTVRARLMRKSLATGLAVEVARVSSVPSVPVRTLSVALPGALDHALYTYFVIVDLSTPATSGIEAHVVRLTTR